VTLPSMACYRGSARLVARVAAQRLDVAHRRRECSEPYEGIMPGSASKSEAVLSVVLRVKRAFGWW
jgi:hypothetical protein